jgi:hypothetical protein
MLGILSLGVKWPEHEADHPLIIAEVKNTWLHTFAPSIACISSFK